MSQDENVMKYIDHIREKGLQPQDIILNITEYNKDEQCEIRTFLIEIYDEYDYIVIKARGFDSKSSDVECNINVYSHKLLEKKAKLDHNDDPFWQAVLDYLEK